MSFIYESHIHSIRLGNPQTLGDFRRMTESFTDEMKLAVRNGPLPELRVMTLDGKAYLEVQIRTDGTAEG